MMMRTTTQGTGSGTLLRRTILLLAVAVLVAAMMVTVASPAFAKGPSPDTCLKVSGKAGKLPPPCPTPIPEP